MKRFSWSALVIVWLCGCGSTNDKVERGATASSLPASSGASLRVRTSEDPSTAVPQKALGAGEVRVALLVLPGDALVEVDKVPVRRRNGMIELVGKVGDEHRVRVFLGATPSEEKVVKIEGSGTSPQLIDANELNVGKSGPSKTPVVFDVNE